jgi:hypothetical protein
MTTMIILYHFGSINTMIWKTLHIIWQKNSLFGSCNLGFHHAEAIANGRHGVDHKSNDNSSNISFVVVGGGGGGAQLFDVDWF